MNPRPRFSFASAALLAFATTGLVFKTGPAVAQQASEVLEEVVVEAPITVRQKDEGTSRDTGIKVIELKQRVSYADLNLSNHADVIELEARIQTISKESCDKLSAMYPFTLESVTEKQRRQRCIREAINSAEKQVQAAIVAAS